MNKTFQFVSLVVITAFTLNSVIAATTICPSAASIRPCSCSDDVSDAYVRCESPKITNLDVSRTFMAIREANNASSSKILNIAYLFLTTEEAEFDLSPLFNFHFKYLDFYENKNLERFSVQSGTNGLISAEYFFLDTSPKLKTVGFGNTFSYFEKNTTTLILFHYTGFESSWVNLTDGSGDVEFLPGLSSFPNLNQLNLDRSFIRKLSGGQFKRMQSLSSLSLYDNALSELGEDALLIQNERGGNIDLFHNNLTDEKIHPNSGLGTLKGGWYVNLRENQFEYISEEKFGRFLSAHPENKLVFGIHENVTKLNPFVCDQRMKWLKDAAGVDVTIPLRATGIYCTNDPGHTIFTTQLV